MAEEFDLIPANGKCDTFKVVFDFYTPRAHFIISPHKKAKKINPELDQNTTQKVLKSASSIVDSALSIVTAHGLKNSAILSIHFGSWLTKKDELHAHICVDVEEYLTILKTNEKKIPGWPSKTFVTKQWKANKNPDKYAENVRQYSSKSYFRGEVEAIKNCGESDRQDKTRQLSSRPPLPPNFRLHKSEPRFVYVVQTSQESRSRETKLAALEAMINFAEQNNLTNIESEDDNNGCHVCLLLNERSNGKSILVNLP